MSNEPGNMTKHYLIATMGTAGDMFPFLRVALGLQSRGNTVTLLCPSIHERYALDAGIPCLPLGTSEQYLAIINDPDLWHPTKGIALVLRSLRHGIEPLVDAIKDMPGNTQYIVLAHPLALPAAAIARTLRPSMKIIGVYLAPSNLRTIYDPLTIGPVSIPHWMPLYLRVWLWKTIAARVVNPAALPDLNAARTKYGLPGVADFIGHMQETADLSLTLFPAWFGKTQPDWPKPMLAGDFQLYDPTPDKSLSPELRDFLDHGEAPIVFTPGTGNRHAEEYFRFALDACRRLNKRAIFLTPFRQQVPERLPDSILWQPYVPFHTLLPHVAALVHHGGIGTVAEALRAGTPQLIIPLAHDQFDNGIRVRSLGVGDVLIRPRLGFAGFLKKLDGLLSADAIKGQCRLVAERFSPHSSTDAIYKAIESV